MLCVIQTLRQYQTAGRIRNHDGDWPLIFCRLRLGGKHPFLCSLERNGAPIR
jgi:hypothetical protein